MRRALEIDSNNPFGRVVMANAYAYANEPGMAIEQCEEALAHGRSVEMVRLNAAATYVKVGKVEEGRRILDEAEKAWYLKVHPLFDSLRGDPRFDALVKRNGIPD